MMNIVHITLASSEKESGTNRKLRQTNAKKLSYTIGLPYPLVSEGTYIPKRLNVPALVPVPR